MPLTRAQYEPPTTVMAFVDAGYLIAGGRKAMGLNGKLLIDGDGLGYWARTVRLPGQTSRLLRTYIYDASYPVDSHEFPEQRDYFDRLATEPGIRLRLGHLTPRQAGMRGARLEQKGVDTLLVLDLVRMAQQRAFDTALIVAGDRDLAEAVRVIADDYSRRVILFGVEGAEPHKELRQVADEYAVISSHELERLFAPREPTDPAQA